MNVQIILVSLIFALAVFYLGRMVFLAIKPGKKKSSCGSCGHCSVDFSKLSDKELKVGRTSLDN